MPSPSPAPTVAFFGATGGCASTALILCLRAGLRATALVRTPTKLTSLMSAHGIPQEVLDSQLTIVEANVKDVDAVKRALTLDGRIVDIVVSGLGGSPTLQWSLWEPVTLDDPTVCATAMATILAAIEALRGGKGGADVKGDGPLVVAISTTGLSAKKRDVPLLMVPLYHWFLAVPHRDKKEMEDLLVASVGSKAGVGASDSIRGFVVVRASLLVDGKARGTRSVRVGWESAGAEGGEAVGPGPAVGYTISREDVGQWIAEEVVLNEKRGAWVGKMMTLTY
ncbi:hypothetical protein BJ546DRAFT_213058 [Cryomyces antarcticus]